MEQALDWPLCRRSSRTMGAVWASRARCQDIRYSSSHCRSLLTRGLPRLKAGKQPQNHCPHI